MRYIQVAGAGLNQTPLAFQSNLEHILQAIDKARKEGVQILCLPELSISGYGCEDTFFSKYVLEASLLSLAKIQEASQDMLVTVGLPMEIHHCLYNVVCLILDKEILGFVAKQELPGDGIYYEPRWFKRWKSAEATTYRFMGKDIPFGDLFFDIGGIRLGLEICEDAWTGVRPAQKHYLHAVDIILNPSASNFAFGKSTIRERLVTEASRAFNCIYVYSNLLGNEAGRIIYDGEILIAQGGELLARNRRFSFEDAEVLATCVDVEYLHTMQKKSFNFEPQFPPNLIKVDYPWKTATTTHDRIAIPPIETREEEFYLAETLALFDYMRKSHSKGFVLSLSGGADSSTCAVLCAHAIIRAYEYLGEERFWKKLPYLEADIPASLVSRFLTCVYQATENSSLDTLQSAEALARGLGAVFYNWDVTALHHAYLSLAEETLGRKLTWEKDDLALQNVQARLRAPGIWLLTNLSGGLLITTSNRSEAAVGYATMDGDTAGGLAPLGGMDKAGILGWLKWAEHSLKISSLSYVNSLQPTAELRPPSYTQTDEEDLMPYDILEKIEDCAIRDYKSPLEVFRSLRGICEDRLLVVYIRKFFNLWSRNQWKRERYAPSFHLDDKNLDPKTWCRFPILNGGYSSALKQLDDWILTDTIN